MYAQRILDRVFSPSGFDAEVIEQFASSLPKLLQIRSVQGVGIGIKTTDNESRATLGPCIVVYVKSKRTKSQIAPSHRIPKHINGIPTDVVATLTHEEGGPSLRSERIDNALRPGVGIEVPGFGSGTAGTFARNTSGATVLLTAGHCLYGNRSFRRGVSVQLAGTKSPGRGSIIGRTLDVHFGLDCGLVQLETDDFSREAVCSDTSLTVLAPPVVGATVEKCGAISKRTQAVVMSVGRYRNLFPAIMLSPPRPDPDPDPLSEDGDSGAVWYDAITGAAIGLHVQGGRKTKSRDEYGVATSLVECFRAFDLTE